jgi:hypothetical protein
MVKFNGDGIITSKLASANKVFDNVSRDEDIVEVKGSRGELGITDGIDGKTRPVTNNEML